MEKKQMSVVLFILAVLMIGTVSASTPITVGGGWISYYIPSGTPPVASPENPFEYSSEGPTHIMITDMGCVGDQPAIFKDGVMLGAGTPVTSSYPACEGASWDPDAGYNGDLFSHACVNMPAGKNSFEIMNIQMWTTSSADGGMVKVEEGLCPSTPAPEFPSVALPVGMMLGLVFIVYSLQGRKE